MIKDREKLNEFCRNLIKAEKFSYRKALSIYEMLHKEALVLGAISSAKIKEGLEIDIKIARIINSLK